MGMVQPGWFRCNTLGTAKTAGRSHSASVGGVAESGAWYGGGVADWAISPWKIRS